MFMFSVLSLSTTDSNQILWKEHSPASPHSCRPLALMLGKETDDELKLKYKMISNKRAALQSIPLLFCYKGKHYKIIIKLKMSQIDGKMRIMLSGLGGAFCVLCTCTRVDAIDLDLNFDINRSSNQIQNIWEKLLSGDMVKKPHDQSVRMGVTGEQIIAFEDIGMLSPLHSILRFFDFMLKIVYHLNAGIFNWSDGKNVLGSDYEKLKNSKDNVRKSLREGTHSAVDIPDATGKGGTTTTGNVIHSIISN